MIRLLLLTFLLLYSEAMATPYWMVNSQTDNAVGNGEIFGAYWDNLLGDTDSEHVYQIPVGFELHITRVVVAVTEPGAAIADVTLSIAVNGTTDSTTSIRLGTVGAPTCTASNLPGDGFLDDNLDWCYRDVDITLIGDDLDYWSWIASGTGQIQFTEMHVIGNIRRQVAFGAAAKGNEQVGEYPLCPIYENFHNVLDSGITSGVYNNLMMIRRSVTADAAWQGVAFEDITIEEIGMAIISPLAGSGECGDFSLIVDGTAVSTMLIPYGNRPAPDFSAYNCQLDDSDLDAVGEWCRLRRSYKISAGSWWAWTWVSHNDGGSAHCSNNATEFRGANISYRIRRPCG